MDIKTLLNRFPALAAVYELAQSNRGHGLQLRNDKRTPYMFHIDSVILGTLNILQDPGEKLLPYLEPYLCVAAGHDLVEDCEKITLDEIRGLIRGKVSLADEELIINGIDAITKKEKGVEEYINYLFRVAKNPLSRVVKRSDLTHNSSDLRPGNMKDKYGVSLWFLENYKSSHLT
jgi:hypothetical protein